MMRLRLLSLAFWGLPKMAPVIAIQSKVLPHQAEGGTGRVSTRHGLTGSSSWRLLVFIWFYVISKFILEL